MIDKSVGIYSKLSRETLILMAGAYFALELLGRAGFVSAPPVVPTLEPSAMTRMIRAAETIEESSRLLKDLHEGLAPRDALLTPQWTGIRHSLDDLVAEVKALRQAIEGNTSATKALAYELEDSMHRSPPRDSASGMEGFENIPPDLHERIHRQSWLERLREWMLWDAAG